DGGGSGGEVAGRVDDALLPGRTRLRGKRDGLAHQHAALLGRRAGQPRYGRVVRQAARGDQQDLRVEPAEVPSDRFAQQPDAPQRGGRRCAGGGEGRGDRVGGDIAVEDLPRLDGPVVDSHVERDRQVD